jgi:hypothetical protein
MGDAGENGEKRHEWVFELPGQVAKTEQKRGESVLGRWSYRLLASKAYAPIEPRLCVAEVLADAALKCLEEAGDGRERTKAEILVWGLHSHIFMQTEDLACLIRATSEFAKAREGNEPPRHDRLVEDYLQFGSRETGEGALSILQGAAKSKNVMRRCLWLPRGREFKELYREGTTDQLDALREGISFTVQAAMDRLRGIIEELQSGKGKGLHALFLRYKHGMPLLTPNLFHSEVRLKSQGAVARSDAEEYVTDRVNCLHVLLPKNPTAADCDKWSSSTLRPQAFECSTEVVKSDLQSSRLLATVARAICLGVVRRAESEGTRGIVLLARDGCLVRVRA